MIPAGVTLTVDSAPIIYVLDGTTQFSDRYLPLFEAVESGRNRIIVSTITIAEVIAGPLKSGNDILAHKYREAMSQSRGWSVMDVTEEIAVRAAEIRISRKLRLPDAIQVSTALVSRSFALVTHDHDFKSIEEIRIII